MYVLSLLFMAVYTAKIRVDERVYVVGIQEKIDFSRSSGESSSVNFVHDRIMRLFVTFALCR